MLRILLLLSFFVGLLLILSQRVNAMYDGRKETFDRETKRPTTPQEATTKNRNEAAKKEAFQTKVTNESLLEESPASNDGLDDKNHYPRTN